MQKIYSHIIATPIAPLKIIFDACKLHCFTFDTSAKHLEVTTFPSFIHQVENNIKAYFCGANNDVNELLTMLRGSDFQIKVWHALTHIPLGTMITYGALSKALNSSPRAIGQACKRNPFPILIPCHRVVGQNSLGGFVGNVTGIMPEIKSNLLQFEQTILQN